MKLDDIIEEWKQDCKFDKTELADESLKTITLHSKYMEMYKKEKLILIKLQSELPKLKLAKYEFYTQGPSKETQELGWEMPAKGAIIKNEASMYMDADQDLINANLRLASQQEKVDLLKDIIDEIQKRRWAIKYAIDWNKWIAGG